MTLKTTFLTATLLALGGPALAQNMPTAPANSQSALSSQRGMGGFERLDANNDGAITRDEVRTARTTTFSRADTNRDNFLDRAEMMAARPMPKSKSGNRGGGGEMLGRADANNDGNITRAEFDAALGAAQSQRANKAREMGQAMFTRLDTNNDGTITRAEADAARAAMQQRASARGGQGNGGQVRGLIDPDTNNDGKVSLAEWLARPDPMFDRGDANNDGRLTREEAAAATRMGRGEGRRPTRPW